MAWLVLFGSQTEKDLSLVEKPDQSQQHRHAGKGDYEPAPGAESGFDGAADHQPGKVLDGQQVGGEVNSDRVHADPKKRDAPFAPLPDFNHLIEGG